MKTKIKILFTLALLAMAGNVFAQSSGDFSVLGVPFGSQIWQAKLSGNTITWEKGFNDGNCGWNLNGVDLSAYERIRIELESNDADAGLRFCDKNWENWHGFDPVSKNVYEAKLNGDGCSWMWEDGHPFDLENGMYIIFQGWSEKPRTEEKTTVVKSVKLLKTWEYEDAGTLGIMGREFGGMLENAEVKETKKGTEVTLKKGNGANAGWNLSGVDLSYFSGIRVEVEQSKISASLILTDYHGGGWTDFNKTSPTTYEAYFSREGAGYKDENSGDFDLKQGVKIFLRKHPDSEPKKDWKIIVKSVELIKAERKTQSANTMLFGKELGSTGTYNSFVNANGEITWNKGKENAGQTGWKIENQDLSAYNKVRITFESSDDVDLNLKLITPGVHLGMREVSPLVYEIKLDGSDAAWSWSEKGDAWDASKINEVIIRAEKISKTGQKTVVKSVEFLYEEDKPQPESIMLNGVRFGSETYNVYIGENFEILWKKGSGYAEAGWKIHGELKGDVLLIKADSDIPLRLRIREMDGKNEVLYSDDGTHIFEIDLATMKQITKSGKKDPEWNKLGRKLNLSYIENIVLEAKEGYSREGKKTVVKSISVK